MMLLGFVLGLIAGGFGGAAAIALVVINRESLRERELEQQLRYCRNELLRLRRKPHEG